MESNIKSALGGKTTESNCQICGGFFPRHSDLLSHMNDVHGFCAVCPHCNSVFKSESGFNYHLKMHSGVAICDICGKSTQSQAHLKRHKLTHSKVKLFSCPGCQKAFKHNFEVIRHMKVCPEYGLDYKQNN